MATLIESPVEQQEPSVWASVQEPPGGSRTITRYPIVDAQGRVHGYELQFGLDARGIDESEAARIVIDDLVLFGYDRLTRGLTAYVRCTADVLADKLLEVLPPLMTVVEIPLSLRLTPKLIEACWNLQQAGFRLALVDCLCNPMSHPLFDLVDHVKVDPICIDGVTLENLRQRFKYKASALIAENVESTEDFNQASNAGFSLFQGSNFGSSEPLRYAKVPANRTVHIEILKQLFPDPLNLNELCPLVMHDPSLVHRLLRLVNSPVCTIRRKVDSVREAITLLGEDTFRRIATLAVRCELNAEQPPEMAQTALVRARFCALAAPLAKLKPSEQYLMGMMSMLPAMLGVPMTALADDLPLRQAAVEALLGATLPERKLLDWVEALERNRFSECHRIADINKLDNDELDRCYMEAVKWETKEHGALR